MEIQDAYDAARRSPIIQRQVFTSVHTTQLGLLWEEYIAPTSRHDLNQRISAAHALNLRRILTEALALPVAEAALIDVLGTGDFDRIKQGQPIGEDTYQELRAAKGLRGFVRVARNVVDVVSARLRPLVTNPESEPAVHVEALMTVWEHWQRRLQPLTPRLIASVHDVNREYLLWLKRHPDVIDRVAWDAFEKIIAEIFASRGFRVTFSARLRNQSADLLAVRSDDLGVETKYLVEIKKYSRGNRVGMDIVNAVLGAARRADVEHAFLVTTSSFTKDVELQRSQLSNLRLHLRDGDDVRLWLRDYRPKSDGGIWLPSSILVADSRS